MRCVISNVIYILCMYIVHCTMYIYLHIYIYIYTMYIYISVYYTFSYFYVYLKSFINNAIYNDTCT